MAIALEPTLHAQSDPPSAPTLTATGGDGSATLNWNSVAGATVYAVYAGSNGSFNYVNSVDSGTTTYQFTGLSVGTYSYEILAYNGNGHSPFSNQATVTLSPPAAPTLTATGGDGSATLNWNSVAGATGYAVYAGSNGGSFGYVTTVGSGTTTFQAAGLTDGTTYSYEVFATSGNGNGPFSNQASVSPSISAPANLQIGLTSETAATLTWDPVPNADSYGVYSGSASGGPYSYIGQANTDSYGVSFTADSLAYYVILAANNGGRSAFSNEVSTAAVSGPGLHLFATSADVSLSQGQNTSSTITALLRPATSTVYPFGVTLAITGLPSGVTAWLYPPSVALNAPLPGRDASKRSSTLFLFYPPGTTVVPGQYPFQVTGTSGSGSASTSLTLTVQ